MEYKFPRKEARLCLASCKLILGIFNMPTPHCRDIQLSICDDVSGHAWWCFDHLYSSFGTCLLCIRELVKFENRFVCASGFSLSIFSKDNKDIPDRSRFIQFCKKQIIIMFNSLSFHEKDNISFTFVRLTRTGSFQVQSLISTNSTHLAHLRFVFQILNWIRISGSWPEGTIRRTIQRTFACKCCFVWRRRQRPQ